jgi:hypothetical protein
MGVELQACGGGKGSMRWVEDHTARSEWEAMITGNARRNVRFHVDHQRIGASVERAFGLRIGNCCINTRDHCVLGPGQHLKEAFGPKAIDHMVPVI